MNRNIAEQGIQLPDHAWKRMSRAGDRSIAYPETPGSSKVDLWSRELSLVGELESPADYRTRLVGVVKQAKIDFGTIHGEGENAERVPVQCVLVLTNDRIVRIDQKKERGDDLSGGDNLHLAVLNALTPDDQIAVREGRLAVTTPDYSHVDQLRLERVAGK